MTTSPDSHARLRRWGGIGFWLLPGGLIVLLSFQAGGYFPGAGAAVTIGLVLALTVRVTTAERPGAGLSIAWAACAALIASLAVWTLVSGTWSHAPGRAVTEYVRALLYLLAFITWGALGYTPQRMRWLLRGLAIGTVLVCVCALITRLAPDLWRVETLVNPERLSYPLTYWNALGLLAALGGVFCLGLTCDAREPAAGRVAAGAMLPVLTVTVVLTFSRGSIVAGAVGLLAVVLVARPALLLSGLVAVAAPTAIAVAAALRAELVGGVDPTSAAATAEGHRLALTLVLCAVAAALVRALLLRVDPYVARLRTPDRVRRRAILVPAGLAVAGAMFLTFSVLDGPATVDRQIDRFTTGDTIAQTGQERLTSVGNNGRLTQWQVALDAFRDEPLRGQGAATWALEWERRRTETFQVDDAHSLYLEVLGELGVVGLTFVVGALALMLIGLALRARGPDRGPAGVLFAAVLAWALHAGVDWDWEMPAVTLWVFAAGGLALATTSGVMGPITTAGTAATTFPRDARRILAGLACLFLGLLPWSVLRSEAPLGDAQRALAAGDCPRAIDRALTSSAAMSSRAEPLFILGVCNVRLGAGTLAVRALDKAVSRDPDNWEYWYGLALVRASGGMDPRRAAAQAARLNPREELALRAVDQFDTDRPEAWRRRAATARLPSE